MPNIMEYVEWRGDITFSASPFNEIDSLILTQLAMVELDGIVPSDPRDGYISLRDAAEMYFNDGKRDVAPVSVIIPSDTYVLFKKVAESVRFGGIKLTAFVSHRDAANETQFAGLTVKLGDGSVSVVFRGTDDTLIGWKEDFNMSFMDSIPAQIKAAEYLDRVGRRVYGRIRVGGHSKGGNLAVYSAVKCLPRIRKRIIEVYNYDGPGFNREFLSLPEYGEISGKIKTIVPQSSLVGMLLENDGRYSVVKSHENGLLQHNAFSWEVTSRSFVYLEELTRESRDMTALVNEWLSKLDMDARRRFVDAVYGILTATNATTLTELSDDKYSILRALKNTDKETRSMIFKIFGHLFGEGGKQMAANITSSLFRSKKAEAASAENKEKSVRVTDVRKDGKDKKEEKKGGDKK